VPRVLLLARSFPPLGGAGVHRTVGSVRHLPEHGYDVVVVTGPGQPRGRWDAPDTELLERIPAGADVHRVDGPEPASPTGVAEQIARLDPRPDRWVRWWTEQSVRLGRRVGAGADVVLVSCAPYETAYAGARLAAELRVPWVADLEDPWALDEVRLYPTAFHRALDRRSMRRGLASAAAIVTSAPEAAARLRRELPDRLVADIPIGFDRDDFDGPEPARAGHAFRIVHAGSLHTELGLRLRRTRRRRRLLGGVQPGLDLLTRSHVFVLEAVTMLLRDEPSLEGRVELHLAGALTAADRAVAERHDFVRVPGLLGHREAVALMRSAHVLFLPMHDLAPGTRAGLIPYKTYEYLGAQRPILAAVPDGDVRDMLASLDGVRLVRPADVGGMAAALRAELARPWAASGRDGIDHLERRRCVAEIAGVLDQVTRLR
jgi:Glycosyl transferases group 1